MLRDRRRNPRAHPSNPILEELRALSIAPNRHLLLAILLLLNTLPTFARSPSAQTEEATRDETIDRTFDERTRVLEVQVPVNVTDRHGEHIRGLEASDFVVLDNGNVQEIRDLQVIDLDLLTPSPERVMDVDYRIPSAARRHFLFLFDLSFSSPTALLRAREAAQAFVLDEMHPSDLGAVAVNSVESGTRLLVTFTPDRAQLARAISTMGNPRLLQMGARDPLRFMIDTPDSALAALTRDVGGVGEEVSRMEASVSGYLQVIGNQMAKMERSYARGNIASWTHSMEDMARMLGNIEGRKHVVYFSEGFDGRLLLGRQPDFYDPSMQNELRNIEDGNLFLVDTDERYGNTQLQVQVSQMLAEFQRANCVIQAVDISGLRADLPSEDRMRRVGSDALFYVANETGGQLYEDANNFGAQLSRVLESSTVTYLLTFRPSEIGEPGEHRDLKVRVQDVRGARVAHRMGYYVPRNYEELHPLERNLLASDLIASATVRDDLDIQVLAAPFKASIEQAYVPVIIEIDGARLLVDNDGNDVPVELYAYATNDKGEMKDFFTQLVTINVKGRRADFASTGLKYYGHVTLGSGNYLLRVLVRNGRTGVTGVETVRVEVPRYADAEPQLLPPFFVEKAGSWFLARETTPSSGDSTVYPFTVNGDPYMPAASPLIESGQAAELCLVAYNFGDGEIDLDARVLSMDGQPVEGGRLALLERTVTGIEGLDKLLATFQPSGLTVGSYTLEIGATDPATRTRQTQSIPFRVLE